MIVKGWSQVLMVFICWATHVLHKKKQKVFKSIYLKNLKKFSLFRLFIETYKHEVGIVSNCMLI